MTESSLPPPPPPPPPPEPAKGTGANWKDQGRPPLVPFTPSARWGLGDAFASYGIFFIGSVFIAGIAYLVQGGDAVLSGPWLPLILATPQAMQGLHVWWVARERGSGLNFDFGMKLKAVDAAVAGALFIVAIVGASIAVLAIQALGAEPPNASVAELAEESEDGNGITVWLVLVAVLASTLVPVVEELVYRGLWWSALLKRGVSEGWTLVITSGVFALAHLEPARTPVLFMLGLAIGWGRMLTGRIGASIIAHAVINAMGMIALLGSFG